MQLCMMSSISMPDLQAGTEEDWKLVFWRDCAKLCRGSL